MSIPLLFTVVYLKVFFDVQDVAAAFGHFELRYRVNINVFRKALELPNKTDECMLCVWRCLGSFECAHIVRIGSTKQKDEALWERSGVDGDNELCGLRKGLMRFML